MAFIWYWCAGGRVESQMVEIHLETMIGVEQLSILDSPNGARK